MSSFTSTTSPALAKSNEATSNATSATSGGAAFRLPESSTLQRAAQMAIIDDKPIMMDYWKQSLEKTVLIGVKEDKEKLLVKSEEEYTSPIQKIYKLPNESDYIIVTENSIYIVDVNIPTKKISA